jgi:predicted metallo-beta-lactamase superfamily hydrolase
MDTVKESEPNIAIHDGPLTVMLSVAMRERMSGYELPYSK